MKEKIVCTPKSLPPDAWEAASITAAKINPVNRPPVGRMMGLFADPAARREAIAILTTKYWHNANGVKLTVGFLDSAPADLRRRIVEHMNAWAKSANVKFTQSKTDPTVRIAREGGEDGGYWSYLGTDILHIAADQPTMNLEAFTMNTPESEFHRVVRHETGHTLGFPHEHMRRALVARIDPARAIAFFQATQGWPPDETKAQVLTPLDESSLIGTAADEQSIMCYQIPGSITKDGKPILGGADIDPLDYKFAGEMYPKSSRAAHRQAA